MTSDLLLLGVGLGFLLAGGESVVRGATGLARAVGVSPLIIGLTVVAFGTSAPELAVNLVAALEQRTDICFGNIVGSNLANIGLVVGAVSALRPVRAAGVVLSREIPMMLLATTAAVLMGMDRLLGDAGIDRYSRGDGLLLLLLFLVFLYYTVGDFMKFGKPMESGRNGAFWKHAGITAFGLAALIGGAELTVGAATSIAQALGVPDVIVGITVLSLGTSLPELVASIMAAIRGHSELALGNIVGSNIFNLLLVFGLTALVRPVAVPGGGLIDLAVLAVFSLMLMLVSASARRGAIRTEAIILLVGYVTYIAWRSTHGIA